MRGPGVLRPGSVVAHRCAGLVGHAFCGDAPLLKSLVGCLQPRVLASLVGDLPAKLFGFAAHLVDLAAQTVKFCGGTGEVLVDDLPDSGQVDGHAIPPA